MGTEWRVDQRSRETGGREATGGMDSTGWIPVTSGSSGERAWILILCRMNGE